MQIKRKIKVGDRYAVKNAGHNNSQEIIQVLKIDVNKEKYLDSICHYTTQQLVHKKKNHECRAWFLLENCVLVSEENPPQTEYDCVIDALNLIDEHAEPHDNYKEAQERGRAYRIVANFIDKTAKR